MSQISIITIIALALGILVFLFAQTIMRFGGRAVRALAPRKILPRLLDRLPINPVTRALSGEARINRLLRQAHAETAWNLSRVQKTKEAGFWIATALFILFWNIASHGEAVLVGGLLIGLALYGPDLYFSRLGLRFRREAEKGLIHIIELLRLHVAAGMNLEGAMRSVAKNTSGVWGSELERVVYRLDAGLPFDDALAASLERFDLPDFSRFLAALKQSRTLGASLGATLGVQAQLLRARRKYRAEEQARTASVKIAIPLVTCIFPALLVIYLAPAVLRVASGL